jgi:hypothetical protein
MYVEHAAEAPCGRRGQFLAIPGLRATIPAPVPGLGYLSGIRAGGTLEPTSVAFVAEETEGAHVVSTGRRQPL